MYAHLRPLDTVFFRDGRAFTMGQENWGASRFPPPPSVVYGALRTRYFAEHPGRLGEAATETDPTGDARLTAFHLVKNSGPLLPMPRDLAGAAEEKTDGADQDEGRTVVRTRQKAMPAGSAALGPMAEGLTHPREVETVRNAYLREGDLQAYLRGEGEAFPALRLYEDDLVHREPKIGIRMDRATRAADEGHLYRIGLHRLGEGVRFGVEIEGLALAKEGTLKLGGEGKAARYQSLGHAAPVPTPSREAIAENGEFLLYLRTPAIFEEGWLPSWIDPGTLRGTKGPVAAQLRAAAVGKPGAIGGWDMKAGAPKPMHRTVPAGSVYHFSLEEGTPTEVVDVLHDTSVSDRRPREGFGRTFVGVPASE